MEIRLDCGNWYANGYIIEGNFESGYNVLNEENEDIVYSDDSFNENLQKIIMCRKVRLYGEETITILL